MTFTIKITPDHGDGLDGGKMFVALVDLFRDGFKRLESIERKLDKVMSALDDANAALSTINDATNQQAANLALEATALQTISSEQQAILAELANVSGVPADLVTRLQAQATATAAIGTSIQQNATFAQQIASAGASNPVPTPVPAPSAPAAAVGDGSTDASAAGTGATDAGTVTT